MNHDYNEGFAAGCLEQEGYEAELRRLHAERDEARADAVQEGAMRMKLVDDLLRVIRRADKAEEDLDELRAEVERLRGELDRRTTLDPAKEMLGWTPKEPK